ncbi:MAG: aminopeptidase, partial [Bdellovibrio sp.]
WKRRSVERTLRDPEINEAIKNKIRLVLAAKEFARSTVGLSPGKNYSSFVWLEREAVSWLVIASPKDRIEAKKWSFLFVGEFPYKGFFSLEKAHHEKKTLESQAQDVWIRPVEAFSYLGWLSDPIFSSFLKRSEADLVELIIHESVHASVFIPNHVDFNEQFASFVALEALPLFFQQNPQLYPQDIAALGARIQESKKQEKQFYEFMIAKKKELDLWYADQRERLTSPEELESGRALEFQRVQKEFEALNLRMGHWLLSSPLNNAIFAAFSTYSENLQDFARVFDLCERSWSRFLLQVKILENSKDPWAGLRNFKTCVQSG